MSADAARNWSARWKAAATRYRAMLAVHRDRDRPRLAALEAENAAFRAALIEDVEYDDGTFMRTYQSCRVCLWTGNDPHPLAISEHQEHCPLAAPPSELGARIVKELAERRRLGDAMAEAINSYMTGVMTTLPMMEAVVAWRALDRRED